MIAWLLVAIGQVPLPVAPEAVDASLAGKTVVVEGVLSGTLGTGPNLQFRLSNSEAKYLVGRVTVPKVRRNVRIEGTVGLIRGTLVVQATRVEALEDDEKVFDQRQLKLDRKDPTGWYELADWAYERGEKYNQDKMVQLSRGAYRQAVAIERRLAEGNAESLHRLQARIHTDARLPDFDLADLAHEVLQAELMAMNFPSLEAMDNFSSEIAQRVSLATDGSGSPLTAAERSAYDRRPVDTFRQAPVNRRAALLAWLAARLRIEARERFLLHEETDRLEELAQWVEKELPQYPDVAQKYWGQWLTQMDSRVESLDEEALERLAQRVEVTLEDPKRAEEIRWRGLSAQVRQLRDHDNQAFLEARRRGESHTIPVEPRTRLATRLLRVAGAQREPAHDLARLLVEEAYSAAPDHPDVLALLADVDPGHRAVRAKARSTRDAESADEKPTTEPEGPRGGVGDLTVGASATEVLDRLGQPGRRARVATRAAVDHVWAYDGPRSTTYVLLRQLPSESTPRFHSHWVEEDVGE